MCSGAIPFPARDSKCHTVTQPIDKSSISSRHSTQLKVESSHFRGPVEWHLNRCVHIILLKALVNGMYRRICSIRP